MFYGTSNILQNIFYIQPEYEIFYRILSVPQSIVMALNNVMDAIHRLDFKVDLMPYLHNNTQLMGELCSVAPGFIFRLVAMGFQHPESLFLNILNHKFLLVLFIFCMQFFHDDGALLIFYTKDPKWTK